MNKRMQGFTLMELMITVAILGIIAAIAFPSYKQYVLRSNRSEAQALLNTAAAREERYYAQNNSYVSANTDIAKLAATPGNSQNLSASGLYKLSISSVANDGGYTLTATPQGSQTQDTKCANLTLKANGTRGVSGTDSAASCWR